VALEASSRGGNTVHDARATLEGGATGSTRGGHQAVARRHTWRAGKVVSERAAVRPAAAAPLQIALRRFPTDARLRWPLVECFWDLAGRVEPLHPLHCYLPAKTSSQLLYQAQKPRYLAEF